MYADSEMSFFGRENLRYSAFQRSKTFFIYSFKRNSSAPCEKGTNLGHWQTFLALLVVNI